jgi:mannose/fructose/N-acetylgalactosamine-specific phosphotransferase system component IIC
MSLPAADLAVLALLGAALALDESATPSLLVSQPLFAGTLCGALLGHLEAGMAAGALVQALWIGALPVGGAVLPDAMLGGVAAAACAPSDLHLAGTAWLEDARLAPPLVVGIGAAWLGRLALRAQRRLQARLARAVPAAAASGDWRRIERLQRIAVVMHLGRGAACTVGVVLVAPPVAQALAGAGVAAPVGRLALALAAVSLGRAAGGRRRWPALAAGALAGLGVAWL